MTRKVDEVVNEEAEGGGSGEDAKRDPASRA